jgi:hypothetical protein
VCLCSNKLVSNASAGTSVLFIAKDKDMRDFRDAKAMAQALRAALGAMGFKITAGQSLELTAQAFGLADWNTLSAAIRAQATAAPENSAPQSPTAETAKSPGDPPNSPAPDTLSGELKSTLGRAFAYAKERKHGLITVEHLLLFVLDHADASRVLQACGGNLDDLRGKLTHRISSDLNGQVGAGGGDPTPTLAFQRVLQRAVYHVQQAGRLPVIPLNVFVAIFSEKLSHAVQLLNEQGVTRIDVVNYMTHGITKRGGGPTDSPTA